MLAGAAKVPFGAAGWFYELKYDGFRCLIRKTRKSIRLDSRKGNDMAGRFPELVAELEPLPHDVVADGELVVLDEQGRPVSERLKKRHAQRSLASIAAAAFAGPAALFIFDLLSPNGTDLRGRTLLQRKSARRGIVPGNWRVRSAGHFTQSADLWT